MAAQPRHGDHRALRVPGAALVRESTGWIPPGREGVGRDVSGAESVTHQIEHLRIGRIGRGVDPEGIQKLFKRLPNASKLDPNGIKIIKPQCKELQRTMHPIRASQPKEIIKLARWRVAQRTGYIYIYIYI